MARYATNAETGFLLRELARRADAPVQEFVVSGATLVPILIPIPIPILILNTHPYSPS